MRILFVFLLFLLALPVPLFAREPVMTVTVLRPSAETRLMRQRLSGVIVPREDVTVSAEISGLVVRDVRVDEGDRVEQGQILAVLDNSSLAPDIGQTSARILEAQRNVQRAETLAKKGTISAATVDQRRTELAASKAQQEQAQWRLGRAVVRAPASGTIYQRQATIGAVADTITPLFRIVRDDALELAIKVPETQVTGYRPGLKATLFPGNSRKGTETVVRRVSPRVDAATRMADVRITVPEEITLPVGAFGYAEVATGEQQGLMIPQQAVLRQGAKSFVMVVDAGNIIHRRAVTILMSDGNQVMLEAAPGLSPQTRLVARAGVFLRDGDLVKVVK